MSYNDAPPFGFQALADVNDNHATAEEDIAAIGRRYCLRVNRCFVRMSSNSSLLTGHFYSIALLLQPRKYRPLRHSL